MSRKPLSLLAGLFLSACGGAAEPVASAPVATEPVASAPVVATEAPPATPAVAPAPQPSLEVALPEGNVVQFFFDEDGVAVNEYGAPGVPLVTLQPELAEATPAEVFWAVTQAPAAVPKPLLSNHGARRALSARPRGWLLGGALTARAETTPLVVCGNTAAAFCGDATQYSSYYCALDTSAPQSRYRTRVERYRAAYCIQGGGGLGDRLIRSTHNAGVCNAASSPVDVWNAAALTVGAAASHSWQRSPGGSYRAYEHFTYAFYLDTLDWAASADQYTGPCISP